MSDQEVQQEPVDPGSEAELAEGTVNVSQQGVHHEPINPGEEAEPAEGTTNQPELPFEEPIKGEVVSEPPPPPPGPHHVDPETNFLVPDEPQGQ